MAKSTKSAANEIAKETAAAEAAAEITAAAEQPAAPEEKAPAKKTAKAKTAKAPVSEPVPAAQPEKKRSCGRKPAAKKAAESSAAAEAKTEKKPAAKRTKKAAVPEQTDFDKFVSEVKKKTEKAKAPADFAAQVAITGKVDGIFYVKAENGSAYAAGYNYVGADLYVTADSETFAELMSGKTDFDSAVLGGKISFDDAPLNTVIAFKKVVF